MAGESQTTAHDRRLARLRREQSQRVMPLIGGLIDAWDGMPNDLKGEIEEGCEPFALAVFAIMEAVENHHE